jgi:hypothetical protein
VAGQFAIHRVPLSDAARGDGSSLKMLSWSFMPDEFDDILFATSRKLDDAGIPHMLTGSYALAFYATELRNTNDLDIVIEAHEKDVPALLAIFPQSEKWYVSEPAVREAIALRRMFNAIHFASGVKVDLVQLNAGEFERLKLSRRRRVERGGVGFWIISPEDLILSKLSWGKRSDSAMQMHDVKVLLRDCPGLDWDYVNQWADSIGVRDWLDRARSG